MTSVSIDRNTAMPSGVTGTNNALARVVLNRSVLTTETSGRAVPAG